MGYLSGIRRIPFALAAADLRPVDRLLLLVAAALALVALLAHPHPGPIAVGLAAGAAALWALARSRSAVAGLLHDFFPLPATAALFNLCGPLVAAVQAMRWDARLAAADLAIFGGLPDAWRGLLGRPAWLVDLASIAYCTYYVVPVTMAVVLRARGRLRDFDRLAFALVGTLAISWVGYFLVPAVGPRVPDAQVQALLGGGAASGAVRAFHAAVELNVTDAFPSGHTALALVFGGHGMRLFPRWRLLFALVAAGIVFATVYLSLHYVIDLVAGALLAAATPLLLPPLERLLGNGSRG